MSQFDKGPGKALLSNTGKNQNQSQHQGSQGGLLFGDFLLAAQEKVTRLSHAVAGETKATSQVTYTGQAGESDPPKPCSGGQKHKTTHAPHNSPQTPPLPHHPA